MSKSKQRNKNKPRQQKVLNAEAIPEYKLVRNMGMINKYAGAARIIELAPPGIQFRALTNIDHVTQISFANKVEEVKVYDEENVGGFGDDGKAEEEAAFHMESKVTGFTVVVGVGGQQNEFGFSKLEIAISFYNDIIEQIDSVGVPMALRDRIIAPPPLPPEAKAAIDGLVGPDGEPLITDNDSLEDPKPH